MTAHRALRWRLRVTVDARAPARAALEVLPKGEELRAGSAGSGPRDRTSPRGRCPGIPIAVPIAILGHEDSLQKPPLTCGSLGGAEGI